MAEAHAAAKAAPAKAAPAPAAAKPAEKNKENAELGALRAKLAQLEEQRSHERRTSDPTSADYNAELALEELWPAQVRQPL
jgi:hypothetical protein